MLPAQLQNYYCCAPDYFLPWPSPFFFFRLPCIYLAGPQQRTPEPRGVANGAHPEAHKSDHPPRVRRGHKPHRVGHDLLPRARNIVGAAGYS